MVNFYWFGDIDTSMQPIKRVGCEQSISLVSSVFPFSLGLQMVWLLVKSDVIQKKLLAVRAVNKDIRQCKLFDYLAAALVAFVVHLYSLDV